MQNYILAAILSALPETLHTATVHLTSYADSTLSNRTVQWQSTGVCVFEIELCCRRDKPRICGMRNDSKERHKILIGSNIDVHPYVEL